MNRSAIAVTLMILALGLVWAPDAQCRERQIKQGRKDVTTLEERTLKGTHARRPKPKLAVPEVEREEAGRKARAQNRRKAKVQYTQGRPRELYQSGLDRGYDSLHCVRSGCRYPEISKYSYRDRPNYVDEWGRNFSRKKLRQSMRVHEKVQRRNHPEDY